MRLTCLHRYMDGFDVLVNNVLLCHSDDVALSNSSTRPYYGIPIGNYEFPHGTFEYLDYSLARLVAPTTVMSGSEGLK